MWKDRNVIVRRLIEHANMMTTPDIRANVWTVGEGKGPLHQILSWRHMSRFDVRTPEGYAAYVQYVSEGVGIDYVAAIVGIARMFYIKLGDKAEDDIVDMMLNR